MESYVILKLDASFALFCDHNDRSKGREKDDEDIFDDTLLDKYERQVEWASRVQDIL